MVWEMVVSEMEEEILGGRKEVYICSRFISSDSFSERPAGFRSRQRLIRRGSVGSDPDLAAKITSRLRSTIQIDPDSCCNTTPGGRDIPKIFVELTPAHNR